LIRPWAGLPDARPGGNIEKRILFLVVDIGIETIYQCGGSIALTLRMTMMPRFRPSLALLGGAAVMLVACSTIYDRQVHRTLDPYIGATEDTASLVFGKAVSHTTLPDGRRRVTFVYARNIGGGSSYVDNPTTETVSGRIYGSNGRMQTYTETRTSQTHGELVGSPDWKASCTIVFELDAAGRISSYSYDDSHYSDRDGPISGFTCSQVLGYG
jgi:hypothetical protein